MDSKQTSTASGPGDNSQRKSHLIIACCLYFAAYVLLDWLSYIYPIYPLGITPWNPPPGLSLFLLVRFGLRLWPVVFLATLIADFLVRGLPVHWVYAVYTALAITAGYWACAYALTNNLRKRVGLDRARDLWKFFIAVVPTTLLVGAAYVSIYSVGGFIAPDDFGTFILQYWLGDLVGVTVVAPALIANYDNRPKWLSLSQADKLEVIAQSLAVVTIVWIIFYIGREYETRLFYPLFLPVVWVAAKWAVRGASLGLIAIQVLLIVAIQANDYEAPSFIQLQAMMLILTVTGLALGISVTHRRIVESELKRRELQLSRSTQFANAGELSSAIAHELNQPLTALSAYLGACSTLLKDERGNSQQIHEALSKAVREAIRASEVVQSLRSFYRNRQAELSLTEIWNVIDRVCESSAYRISQHSISIEKRGASNLREVLIDVYQVEIALHNVMNNAIDALVKDTENHAKRIVITTRDLADICEISISDNGLGIAPEMVPTLFEPFISDKADGMGFGLSISKTFIESNNGTIVFAPSARGATFVIRLPLGIDPQ